MAAKNNTPVMERPAAVRNYLAGKLENIPHEALCAIVLDSGHCVIGFEFLHHGSLDSFPEMQRSVVRRVLDHRNVAAVVFAHNDRSVESVDLVRQSELDTMKSLKKSMSAIDVRVLDYFIVGGEGVAQSLAERGLL